MKGHGLIRQGQTSGGPFAGFFAAKLPPNLVRCFFLFWALEEEGCTV